LLSYCHLYKLSLFKIQKRKTAQVLLSFFIAFFREKWGAFFSKNAPGYEVNNGGVAVLEEGFDLNRRKFRCG